MTRRLSLKQIPQEERPREKLAQNGPEALTDAELLAIVLGSGTQNENALQIAQRLLLETGGLKNLSSMSTHQLMQFHGIGPARAAQLSAALELTRRHEKEIKSERARFSNSNAVFQFMKGRFAGKQNEEFWMLALDAKNHLQAQAAVSKGTLMGSLVHPREVFVVAIKNSAAGIIVLHNHPSGDPEPSNEDRKVTLQLAEAGKVLGIPLLDHIVIGNNTYFSFKDHGII